MTDRLSKMYELEEALKRAISVGDWNRVVYWCRAIENAARDIKAAKAAYKAKRAAQTAQA